MSECLFLFKSKRTTTSGDLIVVLVFLLHAPKKANQYDCCKQLPVKHSDALHFFLLDNFVTVFILYC